MATGRVPGLFITGTDTGVGKTYVAALIARRLRAAGCRVGVYKPAATGCGGRGRRLVSEDAVALWEAAGRPGLLGKVCPQRFRAPLAPHLAARMEGRTVDRQLLSRGLEYWKKRSDLIIVEGLGGLMSPLDDELYVADLAYEFQFPLVVVAKNVLGAINQTLQTLIAATTFRDGLEIAGVVLNNPPPNEVDASTWLNRQEISNRSVPPVLAEVAWGGDFDVEVDWRGSAR